jgi:acyl carrier protein
MREDIDGRLADVFRAVFMLPADADPTAVERLTTDAWDSLGHVSLMTAIESEFDIEVSVIDSLEVSSYETAARVIEELLAERTP